MTPEQDGILRLAIATYGNARQMDKAIEELSELSKAILKLRYDVTNTNITELCAEVADVEVMCAQIRIMMNKNALIDKIKSEKIERLKNNLM